MKLPPVFQNEQVLVVDKPANSLSVPSRLGPEDSRPVVGKELEKEWGRLFPVHRLDFEVSGLIVFARTPEAQRELQKWFEGRRMEKSYEAWTSGAAANLPPVGEWQEWNSKILKGKKRAYTHPQGQMAQTRAQLVEVVSRKARWLLRPLTGRSHQLRFELANHGYPILGDRLYGSDIEWPAGGIALRAITLKFPENSLGIPAELKVPQFNGYSR